MATFVYIGTEERIFETAIGRAPATVNTGDLFHCHPVQMHHAMNPDLVPHDAETRNRVELLRQEVRIADARDFAAAGAGPEGKVDQTSPDAIELIARSEGRSKGRG